MNEIKFLVEDAPEGGFPARSRGYSDFHSGGHRYGAQAMVKDAVSCHFDTAEAPKLIRLHYVREEVIQA